MVLKHVAGNDDGDEQHHQACNVLRQRDGANVNVSPLFPRARGFLARRANRATSWRPPH